MSGEGKEAQAIRKLTPGKLVIASHNITKVVQQRGVWDAAIDHVGNDVIVSADRGKTFQRFAVFFTVFRHDTCSPYCGS